MRLFWFALFVGFSVFIAAQLRPAAAQQSGVALADEGQRLAALLRVGRGVVSNNQGLIDDPAIGDKGLDSQAFIETVEAKYKELYGAAPLEEGLTPDQKRLTKAQLNSMAEVMRENQDLINAEGMGFKGFIPAVFARLVNERFVEKLNGEAKIKVTAPPHLVRNRKARPDAWESAVLTDKFESAQWPRGQPFFEEVSVDGSMTFRMLIPEYYADSCLSCHGGPTGEVDITGFPKEGGAEGDLAGAISILLRK